MATAQDAARIIHGLSKAAASSIAHAPTGIEPGFDPATGITWGEDGRARYRGAASPSIAIAACELTASILCTSGSAKRLDYDTVLYDPQSTITTGASWKFTVPSAGVYLFHISGIMDTATWASTKEILIRYATAVTISTLIMHIIYPIGTSITPTWNTFHIADLPAGEEVYFTLRHTFGSDRSIESGFLAILKVGT